MNLSVIVGSTRQGRFSEKPAQWILQQLHKREGIEARLLDLRDFPMPFFDQPMPPAGAAGLRTRRSEKLDGANRIIGRFYLCNAGIQLRHIGSAEKRDRLGLSGMEPEGCRLCELRQRHGRSGYPTASRNGHRASDGADPIIRSHPRGNTLGAFPGRRCGKGPRRVGEASERYDRRSALVDGGT
jgi:hypothetical protein